MIFLLYASISRILSFKNLAFALLPNPKLYNLAYSPDISLDFKGINAVPSETPTKSTANLDNSLSIVIKGFCSFLVSFKKLLKIPIINS